MQVEAAGILPHTLAVIYANALPWVEIAVGAFLVLGLLSRLASAVGGLAALSFIVGNCTRLYQGWYGECGCFGSIAWLQFGTREALIIDFVLLIMAFQILVHKGEFLSLDSRIFRKKSRKH